MLHTKFCGNRPAGSGEKDFFRIFTIYGPGHVTSLISKIFISMYLKAYIPNLVKNGPVVS